ncbi:MAG: zinc-ribbon domain-containing protein [Bacilli bacterium]|nr:zinc-ribbon domain-containing protein [Bacilli bacterium]
MGDGVEKDPKKAVYNITYLSAETLIQGNVGVYAKDDAIINRPVVSGNETDKQASLYCPECGKKLPVHARFCMGCGKKLEEGE